MERPEEPKPNKGVISDDVSHSIWSRSKLWSLHHYSRVQHPIMWESWAFMPPYQSVIGSAAGMGHKLKSTSGFLYAMLWKTSQVRAIKNKAHRTWDIGAHKLRRDQEHCYLRRRQWHPTPVLLPGKSHGRGSLVGCSPWSREESDTTERLHFHFSLSCIGEGNGNPLQCSCLENPRGGGLPSLGSHRVGHDWCDLAAAAAAHYVQILISFVTNDNSWNYLLMGLLVHFLYLPPPN